MGVVGSGQVMSNAAAGNEQASASAIAPSGLGRRKSRGAGALANVTPSISCMTTNEMPASVPASKTATILGCCSLPSATSCCPSHHTVRDPSEVGDRSRGTLQAESLGRQLPTGLRTTRT